MSFYPSLPGRHHLSVLWKRFPKGIAPLLHLHDELCRDDASELTVGERELIATHVSALNACNYCFVAHARYARAFGIDDAVFGDMTVDTAHPSLRPQMTAALDYAAKLTRTPAAVGQGDFDALLAAGWSEDGINDIIFITGVYAMMNRLLEGAGLKENVAPPGFSPEKARAGRYSDMLAMLGIGGAPAG
ncbi:MAG: peroxidase-related enzyme [Thermohalobaculum sp.]|nr:peroxidase-related enzyme [Thermohalobaculum sp.]